ncbi:MAG: SRPBCC family protein [Planctomycetota bacterium]
MKVVKWLAIIVVVLVLAFVLVGVLLPNKYHVERSVTVDAPAEVVFKYLNDLEAWEQWEPWSEDDDSLVVTLGEVTVGEGATQSWTSEAGKGELEFTMSDPEKGISYDLQFDGYAPSTSDMTFEVVDGKTVLTWTMDGTIDMPVVGGYFAMIMDGMVGPYYENGLNKLKEVAEADTGDSSPDEPGDTDGANAAGE